ncbi:MAG: type II toxin-antitoxin system RelE/ParE family toxin [Verrucomicrobiaceae bacterium]|nr:MAG: type II toxin-antitoxin system RelE/ParE family toxin [Verrucomicrobiaceae bacterium]
MKLVITEAALEDLQSVRDYTLETWGPDQEKRYLNLIWARFENLLVESGRYKRRPDLFPGCQIAAEGKHVILFRCDIEKLEVVRVLHSAMDFKRHLPPGH